MRCASCGVENPEGMKFCGQCAAALRLRCAQCGFDNPPGFAFCGQCGTSFIAEQKEKGGSEAERRHLTVMFCDPVDSVARSQRLDPEEVSEITRQYQEACAQVIRNLRDRGRCGFYGLTVCSSPTPLTQCG
jgi:Double zinc ribbon